MYLYVVKEDPDVFLLQEEVGVSPYVVKEEPDVFLVKVVEYVDEVTWGL